MKPSDEELLRASLDGRPEAFEELMARYERRVYGLLLRLSGQRADADDLFQTVWMQAFSGRLSFRNESRFSTWLYAITLNQARAWRRRMAMTRRRSGEAAEEPADPAPSLLERLLAQDREKALQRALQRLPEADRELVSLYHLEGMDYDTLARVTGRPRGPMRTQLHRAMQRLKAILGGASLP